MEKTTIHGAPKTLDEFGCEAEQYFNRFLKRAINDTKQNQQKIMGRIYKILKIPKTFIDFEEKAKQTGRQVDVACYHLVSEPGGSTDMCYYEARFEFRAGRTILKLECPEGSRFSSSDVGDLVNSISDYAKTIKIAEYLKSHGLETTIHGETINNAKERLAGLYHSYNSN